MTGHTQTIDGYLKRLFPITRSITGEGNRETLRVLQEIIPIEIVEYPSGQQVYDWIIPKEWNIRDAWIKNSKGDKIVDFQCSNLHVLSYSVPVCKSMKLSELNSHLHFIKDTPEAIPYLTTYYSENWGFCLSYNDYQRYFNADETYDVFIDSELKNGSLTVGECIIKGKSSHEYLISTYICHPSLANDNLSGVVLTALLARELTRKELNYSYRIIFVPETIGAVAYCANNETVMKKIDAGFVITSVGGSGSFGYKQTFDSEHPINQIIEQTFRDRKHNFKIYPFYVPGSDERQYSSQGFRINMASITKDKYYEYNYYHTSLDNLDFVKAEYVSESLNIYLQVVDILDKNLTFKNQYPNCEVMLSKHGLYPEIGGEREYAGSEMSEADIMLCLLFYSCGKKTLLEISSIIGIPIDMLYNNVVKLEEKGILKRVT